MKLVCPHCAKVVEVPDALAGQTTTCNLCGGPFTVPLLPPDMPGLAGGGATAPAASSPEPLTRHSAGGTDDPLADASKPISEAQSAGTGAVPLASAPARTGVRSLRLAVPADVMTAVPAACVAVLFLL